MSKYLYIGIGIAVFIALGWWIYTQASRSQARRAEKLKAKKVVRQPWGDDKPRGRGNR